MIGGPFSNGIDVEDFRKNDNKIRIPLKMAERIWAGENKSLA